MAGITRCRCCERTTLRQRRHDVVSLLTQPLDGRHLDVPSAANDHDFHVDVS